MMVNLMLDIPVSNTDNRIDLVAWQDLCNCYTLIGDLHLDPFIVWTWPKQEEYFRRILSKVPKRFCSGILVNGTHGREAAGSVESHTKPFNSFYSFVDTARLWRKKHLLEDCKRHVVFRHLQKITKPWIPWTIDFWSWFQKDTISSLELSIYKSSSDKINPIFLTRIIPC